MKRFKLMLVGLLIVAGILYGQGARLIPIRPPRGIKPVELTLKATGYCACGSCCGWTRNWRGQAVYSSGASRGSRKDVGRTASGVMARPGTIAADAREFPFGTVMYIPGYGYGRVEDRGGAIRGRHIDLYFRRHSTALEWGNQRKTVKVWYPR